MVKMKSKVLLIQSYSFVTFYRIQERRYGGYIVDHPILLQKSNYYGVRRIISSCFSSFLSNRTQSTQIGLTVSYKERMVFGVPQRSVHCPLLFLMYVHDICRCSQICDCYLFAIRC